MDRVITYIDGYNLYHGLRAQGQKRFYWLNLQTLAQQFLRPNQVLAETKYFTTVVKTPEPKRRRQATFLEALETLTDFRIFYGQFLQDQITCRNCGHSYITHHEKMTDVNISVELMTDAFQDRFDLALLISADSDLVGPIQAVRRLFPKKRVIVAFPPHRSSHNLSRAANAVLHTGRNELAKSLLPDQVTKSNGITLQRPPQWQ